jgi:hypothetical protein
MKALLFAVLLVGGSALAAEPVKFGDALNQAFHHPRCLQCHQFNSARHQGRAYNSHQARYLCDRCHSANLTGLASGEWIAPSETKDWTDLDAKETCLLIKRNLPSGDPATKMLGHLLHDVRVRWALDNGMTPGGRFPTVPGGYAKFARQAREWVDGGMLCE